MPQSKPLSWIKIMLSINMLIMMMMIKTFYSMPTKPTLKITPNTKYYMKMISW